MDDQLHAAGFVKEALQHDGRVRRQTAECCQSRGQVFDELARGRPANSDVFGEPTPRRVARGFGPEARGQLTTKSGYRQRKLMATSRRLTQPEGNGGRRSLRVLDAYQPAFHAQDAIGRIAELKHVPGEALNGKIFIDGADDQALWFQDYLKVRVVRNGAAGGQRCEARSLAA